MTNARRLQEAELASIQPLFHRVFGHPISQSLLAWKYAGGHGESWIIEETPGSLFPAVHCGIFFRHVLIDGDTIKAKQLVDLMAAPKTTGLSRDDSPFAILLRALLTEPEPAENPHGIAFGFPGDRAMRLAENLGVAQPDDQLMDIDLAPAQRRLSLLTYRTSESLSVSDEAKISCLWSKMRHDLRDYAVGVHDPAYIRYRYIDRPEGNYVLILVESRWFRKPVGLAVVGMHSSPPELLDIICPLDHSEDVLMTLQRWMAANRIEQLRFSLTSTFAQRFSGIAARIEKTQFRIMGSPFAHPASQERLQGKWWLTGGDTDYR